MGEKSQLETLLPSSPSAEAAYSLVELILVCGVASLLLAITVPSVISLNPVRKAGIHELAGFLENARAQAIAAGTEISVAFADESFPKSEDALRSYALFAPDGETSTDLENTNTLKQVSPWRTLPTGLIFARGEHFDVEDDVAFRTLLDLSAERSFPLSGLGNSGEVTTLPLPALVFGPRGEIREPAFHQADALHLGVIEGHYDSHSGKITYTSTRPRLKQAGLLPNGECLEIGLYTGRSRLLTD